MQKWIDKEGLTSADLASRLKVTRQRVDHWLAGRARPLQEFRLKLTEIAEVPGAAWFSDK